MSIFLNVLGTMMVIAAFFLQSAVVGCTGLLILVLVWACEEIVKAIEKPKQ